MVDIDRQIETAKRKPLTADNFNYIGDLYLKKGDKTRAIAYFYEAVDKLHLAQKEKKLAIYKKILKVSPSSEKACEGIIGILSRMGLVMEEKKYLHMLARIHEEKGDTIRAEEMFQKIKVLDPHVSIPGTFFHAADENEIPGNDPAEAAQVRPLREPSPEIAQVSQGAQVAEEEKLIEATIEEVREHPTPSRLPRPAVYVPKKYTISFFVITGVILLAILAGYLFRDGRKNIPVKISVEPFSVIRGDLEVTFAGLDDPASLVTSLDETFKMGNAFSVLTVKSRTTCIPDAFATDPLTMIMLLDEHANSYAPASNEAVKRATKVIHKMNVCGKEDAPVYVRVIVPFDKKRRCTGIVINGLAADGPLTIGGRSR